MLSGSVSFPLSISSFITLGSSFAAIFPPSGKRRSRTAARWRKIRFRCGISGATKRRMKVGNGSNRNLVISTSMGKAVTAPVQTGS